MVPPPAGMDTGSGPGNGIPSPNGAAGWDAEWAAVRRTTTGGVFDRDRSATAADGDQQTNDTPEMRTQTTRLRVAPRRVRSRRPGPGRGPRIGAKTRARHQAPPPRRIGHPPTGRDKQGWPMAVENTRCIHGFARQFGESLRPNVRLEPSRYARAVRRHRRTHVG